MTVSQSCPSLRRLRLSYYRSHLHLHHPMRRLMVRQSPQAPLALGQPVALLELPLL